MEPEKRGTIAFFSTYRSPVPLDIFSCPQDTTSVGDEEHELPMTDGKSYNYNGQSIPSPALKTILERLNKTSEDQEEYVDSGLLSCMVFVSERAGSLETLHISLRYYDIDDFNPPSFEVFSLADVFGTSEDIFNGVRMEDSGCIAGDYLVYVSTKEPSEFRRQPWTAVYKTNLITGETDRLTPQGIADLSPSVSPSGKKIAVASFQGREHGQGNRERGWHGEIEDLKTDIYVMNVDGCGERKLVVENAGWPTWGSDDVIFFHRKVGERWGVFRADISNGGVTPAPGELVTPDNIDARTPAAIDANRVAVATIRLPSKFTDVRKVDQYRHIEIFDVTEPKQYIQITQNTRPLADHFNPFVIDGGNRIGYHRCKSENLKSIQRQFQKLDSPDPDLGLLRASGPYPSFSQDGLKLAFVDNEFKAVWVADKEGLRVVYKTREADKFFSPVWNTKPNPDHQKDFQLYVCNGRAFHADEVVNICGITYNNRLKQLTKGHNDAFPSTNPDGTLLVFRSTRREEDEKNPKKYKNLYIINAKVGEFEDGFKPRRLTEGDWIDTHCKWSPSGNWIVFSSTRDKPKTALESDNGLDSGYFAVFLVKWDDPKVLVRVMHSGDDIAGHVNHPFFSPDGNNIVVASDLAAVSADPTSLPLIEHSVRPYGDIFTVDIDPVDIYKNENVKNFKRITHSRYENSTASWTMFSAEDPNEKWNMTPQPGAHVPPSCPFVHGDGGESWHMTGQLCIPKRCC